MTKPSSPLTPEEKDKLKANQAAGKILPPDTRPTSLIMGQSTPMNGQSPLQNNPPQNINSMSRGVPPQSPPLNRPINMGSNQAQLRIQQTRAQNTANLQRQLGDRYSSFEEERKRIQQSRRGFKDKANDQALRELRAKYGIGGRGQANNPTQNNFNQLRDTLNPKQPQQNAQQPQGALSQAAQQLAAQPPISKDGMNWQNKKPRPDLPGILNQQNSQQAAPAQPQQPNVGQPQGTELSEATKQLMGKPQGTGLSEAAKQLMGQPEQTAPNQQAAPAQDNSSIDQQIAALQQQIAQLQAQKK